MKYTLLTLLCSFSLAGAASLNLTNAGTTPSGNTVVTNNLGEVINAPGAFALLFQDPDDAPQTFEGLQSFIGSPLGANALAAVPSSDGGFSVSFTGPGVGQTIFLVLGDQQTAATSDALGFINTGLTFDPDPIGGVDTNNFVLAPGAGTVVLGSFGEEVTADWQNFTGVENTGPSFQLVSNVIPEPSVALLGGLALFGGLVRRRR